jgi:predicted dehydrogenase
MRVSTLRDAPVGDFLALFEVVGERGSLRITNPLAPQAGNLVQYQIDGRGKQEFEVTRRPSYTYQLEAFCRAIAGDCAPLTGGSDSIANMRVIDDVYEVAGLRRRGSD